MTAHLSIRSLHEAGRTYQISQKEAERRGLPVIRIKPQPVDEGDLRKTAGSREGKLYRMARDIRAAKDRGVRQSRDLIAMKVAFRSGMTLSELLVSSDSRERDLSAIRHRAFYGIRLGTSLSLTRIGHYFGMDHSSIHYGIKQHRARLAAGEAQ
jgi:hypothetical protein